MLYLSTIKPGPQTVFRVSFIGLLFIFSEAFEKNSNSSSTCPVLEIILDRSKLEDVSIELTEKSKLQKGLTGSFCSRKWNFIWREFGILQP